MPRPWKKLDSRETSEGRLELLQRGPNDFMITIQGRVLMTSALHLSEVAVAEIACAKIRGREAPRVLTAGLGLGYTLRAALDTLPKNARVDVAELNAVVVDWVRGPVSALTNGAIQDRRVRLIVGDVMDSIREAERRGGMYDAIVLDLYVGPGGALSREEELLYGARALESAFNALTAFGVYAVWAEKYEPSFENRLRKIGFETSIERPRTKGLRHVIYVATKPKDERKARATAK